MSTRFDEILDECLDRILLHGETVEDCLARYSEFRAELEPHLRLATLLARSPALAPSPAAKERGHARLLAELRALQQAESLRDAGPAPRRWETLLPRPRWAMGVAALVLGLVLGGTGAVAASGDALPGDVLYPVKRAGEQVRMGLELSPAGKGALHLAYAERRAEELSLLIQEGEVGHLETAQRSLRSNLEAAAAIGASLKEPSARGALRSQLEVSASQVLASFQAAVETAPEATRLVASDSFQASSEAYGNAVETVAARAPMTVAYARMGTLQLLATDPPPPGVEKVLVQVGGIEALLVSGATSRWVTITEEPQTFDLLRIAAVQKFLGEQQVEPGTYTKIRFRILEATAVAAGVEHQVKVPSEHISLTRPFRVEEGEPTIVVLDFDGARSLHVTGAGQYMLTPQVGVFTQEPKQKQEARDQERPGRPEKPSEKPQDKGGRGTDTPARVVKVEVEGAVEQLGLESVIIRGKQIAISPDTPLEHALQVGQQVKAEALVQPDGSFLAVALEAEKGQKPADKENEKEKKGKEKEDASGGQPRDVPQDQPAIRIVGMIQTVAPNRWTVGGQDVIVGPQTRIEGTPGAGLRAQIEGERQPDGSLLAITIQVLPEEAQRQPETPDGGKQQEPQPPAQSDEKQEQALITGTIEEMRGQRWRVGGQTVLVTGATSIVGAPAVGLAVKVEGVSLGDGSIRATRISLETEQPKDIGGAPPAPQPTPTAVPAPTATPTVETQPAPQPLPTEVPTPTATPTGETVSAPQPLPTEVPTPTVTPTPVPVPTPTPGPGHVELEGRIEAIQADTWLVAGETIVLNQATKIDGTPAVGSLVHVEGVRSKDGTIRAIKVIVLASSP